MSKEYTQIVDRVIAMLEQYRLGSLSADMSEVVTAIKKGQYVPTSSDSKPIVYVRYDHSGLIRDLAGGKTREERILLRISGAVSATSQAVAADDGTNLMNNIQQVLQNHATGEVLWGSANRFGWNESNDSPEVFGQLMFDPGADITNAHFTLLWSCDVRITTETIVAALPVTPDPDGPFGSVYFFVAATPVVVSEDDTLKILTALSGTLTIECAGITDYISNNVAVAAAFANGDWGTIGGKSAISVLNDNGIFVAYIPGDGGFMLYSTPGGAGSILGANGSPSGGITATLR